MFDLERRKQHTYLIVEYIKHFLFRFTKNNAISGFIVYLIHHILVFSLLLYLLLGKVNMLFYVVIAICLFIIGTNYYFNGCICIYLERNLWNSKKWWGPLTIIAYPLEKMNVSITRNLITNIFICYTIFMGMFTLMKILYYVK